MPSLETQQRWMQAVITASDGVPAGLGALQDQAPAAAGFIRSTPALGGAERLAIYWRSYHARLLQTLQALFPAARHALGDALFDRFGLDYLERHRPSSFTLDRLADRFAQHLADTRPDDCAQGWSDFLIDLVRLEWALHQVYHAPGWEERRPARPQAWAAWDDAAVLGIVPVPNPALRQMFVRYPVHVFLQAVRRGEQPALPEPAAHHVVISRRSYRVALDTVPELAAQWLAACDGQRSVHAVCATLPCTPALSGVREWLMDWTARQWVRPLAATAPMPHLG
jgi:hypothetical protein